ncbi:hypothetical protein TNCV_4981031 [Trichonephila clavipes]|nr:hypothetical protein TNCV_4981031 [Trichonephila clavipes]
MECVCTRSRTQDLWCQQRMFLQAAPSILRGVLPKTKVDKALDIMISAFQNVEMSSRLPGGGTKNIKSLLLHTAE